MITEFVINYPATLIGENILRVKIPAVCSKVLDLLRTQAPLVALPATLEPRSADAAETVIATREGMPALLPTSRRGKAQESALVVSPSSDRPTLSNAASRQQFLLALLEDCSFFAHLVLRSVRAGCSLESAPPGSDCRSTSVIQSEARPSCNAMAQRPRGATPPAIAAEPVSPTLQTLWANVACRHMRSQRCTGEMS